MKNAEWAPERNRAESWPVENGRTAGRGDRMQMSRAEHLAILYEFATGLAHEIRNPLAGIAGVVEVIGRDLPTTSPARSVVNDVRFAIARIDQVLAEMLQSARSQPPKFRKCDLNRTADDAVMLTREQVPANSTEIRLFKPEPLLEVDHDSDQIRQVLVTLLLFTTQSAERGVVTVTAKRQNSMAVLEVCDKGRCIAAPDMAHIFRPFPANYGCGPTLDLWLARRIVEDHQGRIDVTSALGEGTTFSVVLPMS